ncbi:MAG: carbohydrate ABC transporter substrate-binding protein, partial [Nocardioides sp.]|nr:carbohydrate ABC transporter substrate-binding protein [Nocardioides sp.]
MPAVPVRTTRRRRILRAVSLGAAAVLVTALSTACSSSTDSSSGAKLGKNDVVTLTTFSQFGYNASIKKWNADPNRPFTIKQTVVSDWDPWKQTLTRELQSGTGLTDVIAVEGDSMPAFLADGASDQFVDLTDHSLDNRWLDYKYKAGQTADGKQIGYPTDAGPEAFCYRSDLFAKAGLPSKREDVTKVFSSWDSYFQAGEAFHKKVPGVAWYDSEFIAQAMLNQEQFPFQTKDQ